MSVSGGCAAIMDTLRRAVTSSSHKPIFQFLRKMLFIDMHYNLEVSISSKLCLTDRFFSFSRNSALIDIYYTLVA